MRIAVCMSGQIRTGHQVAPNILRYIGDLRSDCDFFIHTWDEECIGTGHARRLQLNDVSAEVHTTQLSDQIKAQRLFEYYQPRAMTVESYSEQPTRPLWGGRRWDPERNLWLVSMWQSVARAADLKRASGIHYDYSLRIRPDLVFHPDKSLAQDLDQIHSDHEFLTADQYGIMRYHRQTKLEDIFWLGPDQVMDQIMDYAYVYSTQVKNIDDPKQPGYQDWQFHSAKWITGQLGLEFRALKDNRVRCFYDLDLAQGRSWMQPNFGIDQYNPRE